MAGLKVHRSCCGRFGTGLWEFSKVYCLKITQMESEVEDRWLSVDEIADYLGIKRDTVYKWIADKGMPAHKIGRLWKFKKDEVDGWVRDGKAGESSDQE